MRLVYEDRSEMQRSLRKAGIREVFVRRAHRAVRVTALMDSRLLAVFETAGSDSAVEDEIVQWRSEHFEVLHGEVVHDGVGEGGLDS